MHKEHCYIYHHNIQENASWRTPLAIKYGKVLFIREHNETKQFTNTMFVRYFVRDG